MLITSFGCGLRSTFDCAVAVSRYCRMQHMGEAVTVANKVNTGKAGSPSIDVKVSVDSK